MTTDEQKALKMAKNKGLQGWYLGMVKSIIEKNRKKIGD